MYRKPIASGIQQCQQLCDIITVYWLGTLYAKVPSCICSLVMLGCHHCSLLHHHHTVQFVMMKEII